MRHTRIIITAILALLLINIFAATELKEGENLKPFSLKTIDDKVITLRVEDGKLTLTREYTDNGDKIVKKSYPDAVLIDFWTTWCVPCRAAYPYLQKLHEKFKPEEGQCKGGAEIIGISLDRKGSKIVKPFLKKIKVTYTILAGSTGKSGDEGLLRTAKDVGNKYKIIGVPVVYLIDSEGVIQHVHTGFKKEFMIELENMIKELISEEK